MKQNLVTGTILLTISSLLCRFIGFFYRIFLSHTIGAEGMGIFQLILPLYNLSLALTASGIQTALSRLIAAAFAKNQKSRALILFFSGTIMAFSLSMVLSFFIRSNASFLGTIYLKDARCIKLLQIVSLVLPFSALHACMTGWFLGVKNIKVPALIQTLEELVRFAVTYLLYLSFLKQNIEITPMIAVIGLLGSELFSVLVSFFFLWKKDILTTLSCNLSDYLLSARCIIKTGFPLTMNRILLNILHSIESVLLPLRLQNGTVHTAKALQTFGTITGMALPLVLFPTAIINAMSSILLPTISEKQARQNNAAIIRLVKKTTWYSFFIGIFFSIFFLLFGNMLGSFLYKSSEAGQYIKSLSLICPFLFINITLASVMNGLGKTHLCFLVNLIDMLIRITAIYVLVPSMQISGYVIGLVGGEFVCSIVSLFIILKLFS